MKYKIYSLILLCLLAFSGCLFAPEKQTEDPSVKIQVVENDTQYVGIPLKFWVTLKKPVSSNSEISWERGTANIFKRGRLADGEIIRSDTIYLEWRELPQYTRTGQSNKELLYLDTIRAIVNGVRSQPIAVEIKNIFPVIDSIAIENGLGHRVINDSIYISVPQGAPVVISPVVVDKYNESTLEYNWPEFLRSNGENPKEGKNGVFYFDDAPIQEVDYKGNLSISDGLGGERDYHIRYRSYDASKSVWVGSNTQLIKFAEEGFEIFKSNYNLGDEIILGIHRAFNALYVADDDKKILRKYSTLDLKPESNFLIASSRRLQNIALSPSAIWVAEEDPVDRSKSMLLKYSADNGASQNVILPKINGQVLSMSTDPQNTGRLWYINSIEDTVYVAQNDSIIFKIAGVSSPKILSYDFESGICWVASSTTIYMISKYGNMEGQISGFKNINSVSAGSGFCWVSDSYLKKIWLLNSINTRKRNLDALSPDEVEVPIDNPVHLSIVNGELPSVWVLDAGKGALFKISAQGSTDAILSGMIQPRVVAAQ